MLNRRGAVKFRRNTKPKALPRVLFCRGKTGQCAYERRTNDNSRGGRRGSSRTCRLSHTWRPQRRTDDRQAHRDSRPPRRRQGRAIAAPLPRRNRRAAGSARRGELILAPCGSGIEKKTPAERPLWRGSTSGAKGLRRCPNASRSGQPAPSARSVTQSAWKRLANWAGSSEPATRCRVATDQRGATGWGDQTSIGATPRSAWK
jgi:hypothetical protein